MIFGVRHGERADKLPAKHPERKSIELDYDPHLTSRGVLQAEETGRFLKNKIDEYASQVGTPLEEMQAIIIVSPFLRTIQTAYSIAKQLRKVYENSIYMQEEICEYLDRYYGNNPLENLFCRKYSQSLKNYFDINSFNLKWNLITPNSRPKYPETINKSIERVDNGIQLIKMKFFDNFDPKKFVFIYVTHQYTLEFSRKSFLLLDGQLGVCQYCAVLQVYFKDTQSQAGRNNPKVLIDASSEHIKHLL